MPEDKVRRLMHLLITLQVANDEIDGLPQELERTTYKRELKQETRRYQQATRNYINALVKPNQTLIQIWEAVPSQDMDELVQAKRRLIHRMQNAQFEEINEMDALLSYAERKRDMMIIVEEILEKHTIPAVRDMYRQRMGYTEEQFKLLKQMN